MTRSKSRGATIKRDESSARDEWICGLVGCEKSLPPYRFVVRSRSWCTPTMVGTRATFCSPECRDRWEEDESLRRTI